MTAMRVGTICTILILIVVGCGYNPDKPVYDTKANPEGYPDQALALLDRIQSGTLDRYDAITEAFAELYQNDPKLLDNQQWLQVVSRLGVKFRYQADKLVEQGMANYHQAAQLYTLAGFARPSDDRLQHRRILFTAWEKAIADSVIPVRFNPDSIRPDLASQLRILRYFILADSASRQFAEEFLAPRLLDVHAAETALKAPAGPQNLSVADRCFLTTLGFKYKGPDQVLASFSEPAIDLVVARLDSESSGWYGAEIYFIPRESLQVDYTIALRVKPADSAVGLGINTWTAFDFHPATPTSSWKKNEIIPAYRRFVLSKPIGELAVGLFQAMPDSAHFVRLRDTGEPLVVLPRTTIADR